jgi:fructose-bisphosphate aldolase class II
MSLVNLNDVLIPARMRKYAVGAYDFINMETLYGILDAAEETNTPVIVQYPDVNDLLESINTFAPLIVAAAARARVPVVVHLDHGKSFESCKKCVEAGFTSVMIDASTLPYEENVQTVKKVVAYCKPKGIPVEAELGHVGEGSSYNLDTYMYTDPLQAAHFVEETDVDALAVAIGNAHGAYQSDPKISYEVLEEIAKVVSVPLVLHGGSGISDQDLKKIIKGGIAKINIFTELAVEAATELRKIPPNDLNLFRAIESIRTGFKKRTLEKIQLFETESILGCCNED